MSASCSHLHSCLPFVVALLMGASGGMAQDTPEAPRPQTSVRGTLVTVNHIANTVVIKSDEGENLGWRFQRNVIQEMKGFEEGTRVIVIYRDLPGGVKRVTAVAFPGTEKAPTYVNMTGERVLLRSAPPVDGGCDHHAAGPSEATETHIPPGGRAEALEACWCCAVDDGSCATTTKTGVGRAYLMQCFE